MRCTESQRAVRDWRRPGPSRKIAGMEPTDLTIKVLQEIRDEGRGTREEMSGLRGELTREMSGLRAEMSGLRTEFSERFEVLETTLRDPAQQLVLLARGIKTALESPADTERRLDDHERRLAEIEKGL